MTITKEVTMNERQRQTVAEFGVKPEIDARLEIENRTNFLANELGERGLNGFVLGISGGQDSLLAGLLAQRAVEKLRAQGKPAEFRAMLLPYGEQADREDALLAIRTINPDVVRNHNIKPAVDAHVKAYAAAEGQEVSDFSKGNIKARERMVAQFLYANENGLAVIGTDHAAEAVMGFFTKFGDGAADILPLAGLNKRQGKALLRQLGAPAIFITKAPTADLLDKKPGQTDEEELGITIDTIDDYLEGKDVGNEAAALIEAKRHATQHKREEPIAYEG